jgi:ATP-binding cassette subfamily G (WHITE) protein 2 (SNQ2)
MIPVFSMPRWLFWIYYIDPLNYGFASLMINEFMRIELRCDAPYLIPFGGQYTDASLLNKVCTLAGSQSGNAYVSGKAYIATAFQMYPSQLWRNFGIIIAFFLAFQISQMIVRDVRRSIDRFTKHLPLARRALLARNPRIGRHCLQA